MEIKLIQENIEKILFNNYEVFPPENKGELFLKK